MNPILLLMGLLVLAYIGSFVVGERRIRGLGLPSGAEYLALGFLLGPTVFGLLDRATLALFDPIAQVALGWIALVIGLGFGVHRREKTRSRHVALGVLFSLVTALGVAAPLWLSLTRFTELRGDTRLLLVAGAALACAETTRESVRWVTERYGASGPVSSLVSDVARSDDIVPLCLLALCFASGVSPHLPGALPASAWALVTLVLGVVFGGTAALIIGKDLRVDETWGTLIGISVLCTGVTARLGLSSISAMFAMGLALAMLSGQRQSLLTMTDPTERTVLHPVLLLAGARIDLFATGALPLVVGVAILARTATKGLIGLAWQAASTRARHAGPLLGMGLLSAGTLSVTVGLAYALRFPGAVGDTVLTVAATSTLFGEFVGPFALRASLRAAGEIAHPSPAPETA